MAIIIDLIVIAILVLSTFLGYKKGLIGVAFKILSFLIAIVITLILYRPISNYIINNTEIALTIENSISEKLSKQRDCKYSKRNRRCFSTNSCKRTISNNNKSYSSYRNICNNKITLIICKSNTISNSRITNN